MAVDTLGVDAAEGFRRGFAGLSELPMPDATHRMDHAAVSHRRHPRLRRCQTTAAEAFGKIPENPECEAFAITAGRRSYIFLLTQASAGRIDKRKPANGNALGMPPSTATHPLFNPDASPISRHQSSERSQWAFIDPMHP